MRTPSGMPSCSINKVSIPIRSISATLPICTRTLAIAEAVEQLQSLRNVTRSRVSADLIRTEISADDVPTALLREAECWNADLMVMGTHGRRGIIRTYFGSVPNRVASLVKIPLIQVCERHGEKAPHAV